MSNLISFDQLKFFCENAEFLEVMTKRVPTLDEMIEWLREKFLIVIYNHMEPFVSPTKGKIIYCYRVKQCNLRDGWNGRNYLGQTEYSEDICEVKKQAIEIAINYLKNEAEENLRSEKVPTQDHS